MKKYVMLLSCCFFYTSNAMSQNIADYTWKNRVLLLVDKNIGSNQLKKQLQEFQNQEEAFQERDLIYFIRTTNAVYDASLNKIKLEGLETYQKTNFSGVVLLGKDGGVKLKESFLVTPKTIIDLIDSMPMRRSEMKSKQ